MPTSVDWQVGDEGFYICMCDGKEDCTTAHVMPCKIASLERYDSGLLIVESHVGRRWGCAFDMCFREAWAARAALQTRLEHALATERSAAAKIDHQIRKIAHAMHRLAVSSMLEKPLSDAELWAGQFWLKEQERLQALYDKGKITRPDCSPAVNRLRIIATVLSPMFLLPPRGSRKLSQAEIQETTLAKRYQEWVADLLDVGRIPLPGSQHKALGSLLRVEADQGFIESVAELCNKVH